MIHPIYGKKSVAFAFIVKDGQDYLERNIKLIQNLGRQFSEYKIFFVENDSEDDTRPILKSFMNNDPNIIGKFYNLDGLHSRELCKKGEKWNCTSRVRRIASIRNKVLVLARENNFDGDYLVMLDLDFDTIPDPSKLFEKMNSDKNIDGIFGTSITNKQKFYDLGAVLPKTAGKMMTIMLGYKKWVPVKSAFSGFGLYRWDSIKNNRYNENTSDIEHIDFNLLLKNCLVNTNFNPFYRTNDEFESISRTQVISYFWILIAAFFIISSLIFFFLDIKLGF